MPALCSYNSFSFRDVTVAILVLLSGCATLRNTAARHETERSARQFSQQGMDAFQRGAWDEASWQFEQALAINSEDEEILANHSRALWNLGKRREAVQQMVAAIQSSDGANSDLIVDLGEMLFKMGDINEAMLQADFALQLAPKDSRVWLLKGAIKHRAENRRDALTCYHRALSYTPENIEIQLAMAQVYRELGRPQRTLATLERASRQREKSKWTASVHHLRGLAFHELRDYDSAVASLTLANRMTDFPSAQILYDLSLAQMKAGQIAQAQHSSADALQIATVAQKQRIRELQFELAKLQPNSIMPR